MQPISFVRLIEIDQLPLNQKIKQIADIATHICNFAPNEPFQFQLQLVFYQGQFKKELKQMVQLRHCFHNLGKLSSKEKIFLNLIHKEKTKNMSSPWQFLRFWQSSQKKQQQTQQTIINNQLRRISLQMQSKIQKQQLKNPLQKSQHLQQKKLLYTNVRSKKSILDGLQEEQQEFLSSKDIFSVDCFAKQTTKTEINQGGTGNKLKKT